jgi:leucyl/phenylalanyl-tRNA--protein transferase
MIPWLAAGEPFPPVAQALREPDGLLAAGSELSPQRLRQAYAQGIFPWYSDGQPVLWWSPNPRMVLYTAEFRPARSLRKRLRAVGRGDRWRLTLDHAFVRVMQECAAPRATVGGTWITAKMAAAYDELHRAGCAHSVEVWDGEALVGGLYGVALGRMFFGESMFSRATDASKTALALLVRILLAEEMPLIDCQQATAHLSSLGARCIDRAHFCAEVVRLAQAPPPDWQRWQAADLAALLSEI